MAKRTSFKKIKSIVLRVLIIILAASLLLGIVILPIMAKAENIENVTVESFETGKLAEAINKASEGTDLNFIKNIAILDGTLNADDYAALKNIPNLEIIELAKAETEDGIIPENALSSKNQLSLVTLPCNTVEIGKNAFSGNRKLVTVLMPATVTRIDDYAFASCEAMTAIPISAAITYIGEGAFQDCKALTEFVIPSGITEIYANTFSKCGFKQISIGPDIKKIGMSVFADCNALKDVYVYGSEAPELGGDVFRNVSAVIHCHEDAQEAFESWKQNNISITADLIGEYTLFAEISDENKEAYTTEAIETAAEEETAEKENTEAADGTKADKEAVTESVTTSEEAAEVSAGNSGGTVAGLVIAVVIMAIIIVVLAVILVISRKNNGRKLL